MQPSLESASGTGEISPRDKVLMVANLAGIHTPTWSWPAPALTFINQVTRPDPINLGKTASQPPKMVHLPFALARKPGKGAYEAPRHDQCKTTRMGGQEKRTGDRIEPGRSRCLRRNPCAAQSFSWQAFSSFRRTRSRYQERPILSARSNKRP